jgi:integrase
MSQPRRLRMLNRPSVETIAHKADAMKTLKPKTARNHLALLHVMFKVAMRWRLVQLNPVDEVEPPRVDTVEMNALTEAEIARLLAAYDELEREGDEDERAWWRLSKRVVEVALATGLRRGELLGLRWQDVELLEHRLHVRETIVRGKVVTPKSRTSRRMIELGPHAAEVLGKVFEESRYRSDNSRVFCRPALGTALDPSHLSRKYLRPALKRAAITKPFRPFHDVRHSAITHEAAAGNPQAYVQLKAGHSQGSITERYIHAAQVLFPGAAAKAEERIFGSLNEVRSDEQDRRHVDCLPGLGCGCGRPLRDGAEIRGLLPARRSDQPQPERQDVL